jgi:hypothetical protein
MKNELYLMVAGQTAEIAWLCGEVKALRRRLDRLDAFGSAASSLTFS